MTEQKTKTIYVAQFTSGGQVWEMSVIEKSRTFKIVGPAKKRFGDCWVGWYKLTVHKTRDHWFETPLEALEWLVERADYSVDNRRRRLDEDVEIAARLRQALEEVQR